MAAKALSRAAAESRPAPAYLLSGTRGVGKTTIARIFAKALNCSAGPSAEPCNQCEQCRHIIAGNHVDVCEIDGASNTGVDDVRALREKLGFVPMEGKFKIFIIDEAHMLSKSAFNALLKTLEEPPRHTVFVFATTEAHRFPATIISRCQHFVFRHLPEELIFEHLSTILAKENVAYEDAALRLIAKRASGSARDSLSLLDQVLSITTGALTAQGVRAALGLAGIEFFSELFTALSAANCAKVVELAKQILFNGVDIGFFVRELANWLRNLFLWRQSGEAIITAIKPSSDELAFFKQFSPLFSAAHLHSSWQMVLEAQRGISQSPDPGAVLELLLINLAMLPHLLPIGLVDNISRQEEDSQKAILNETRYETFSKSEKTGLEENLATGNLKPAFIPNWEEFKLFCQKQPAEEAPAQNILNSLKAIWHNNKLILGADSQWTWELLQKNRRVLDTALQSFCHGEIPEVSLLPPAQKQNNNDQYDDFSQNPEIQLCKEILNAEIDNIEEKQ